MMRAVVHPTVALLPIAIAPVKINILWERTGFDLEPYARLQAEDDGWPLKTSIKKNINANDNVDMEFAPSVAEADEILAKFGYVEEEALQPVA